MKWISRGELVACSALGAVVAWLVVCAVVAFAGAG